MAKDKTSFVLYCDLIHTISKLPDVEAGKLFKIILQYVNDENPTVEDLLLSVTFEPIKQQLKRDLVKYTKLCDRNSANGAKGGRPTKAKKPTGLNGLPEKPRKADSDNDNDNVSVNVTDNDIKYPYGEEFLKSWNIWKTYKKEQHNFKYKGGISEQAALKKLTDFTMHENEAIQIIHNSIENGYKGLFELKQKTHGRSTSKQKLAEALHKEFNSAG